MIYDTNDAFEKSGLICLHEKEITAEVLDALDNIHEQKMEMISNHVPKFLQKAFADFAGVRNSKIYNAFHDGNAVYLSKILKK